MILERDEMDSCVTQRLGLALVLLTCCITAGSTSHTRIQPLRAPVFWGPWSQWSACSSQCGEGVETRVRQCLQWGQDDRYTLSGFPWQCEGYGEKKRLCYGKCEDVPPPPSSDQCSGLNDAYGYTGSHREWIEVKRGFPCEVVCRSKISKVTRSLRTEKNGTPCQTYGVSNGECFAGMCRSVEDGCRDSYGKPLQVDMCMKCGGVNATCQRKEGTFRTIIRNSELTDMPLVVGIPAGTTSIEIVKYGRATNTLALVDSSDRFIINEKGWPSKQGDYKIDGVTWVYRQMMNQESLTSSGPIVAPITIRLTTKHERQVVHYSLWVPQGKALGPDNYSSGSLPFPFQLENEPRNSNFDRDIAEPFTLKTQSSREFEESYQSENYPQSLFYNRKLDMPKNKREPLDIQSFDKSAQLQIESHPSRIRDFDEPMKVETEPNSVFGVEGTKTVIVQLENDPESSLDESDANTVQLETGRAPTIPSTSSSSDDRLDSADNGDIWDLVESELKKQGEDYIWELVEWQLRVRKEEAIWQLVEEALKNLGEEAIWELVEAGLRRLHKNNENKTSRNKDVIGSIRPKKRFDSFGNEPDVLVPSGNGGDEHVVLIDTRPNMDRDLIGSGKSRGPEKENRTQRLNVALRELLVEDNQTSRVRPKKKVKRIKGLRKPSSDIRPRSRPRSRSRPKQRKKKNGRWRPNDIYISLKPNEHCFPCIRPKDKVRQFCTSDFVSKVHVNRRKVIGNETRYDVTILSSYRNRVRLLQREYIWMESTCRCPRIKTKRTYIVMGKMEDLSDRQTRLVITPNSYIRGFSIGFDGKIRQLAKTIQCPGK